MTNFEKAKNIVEDYRKLRLDKDAKNSFRLHEKLAEVGYTDIKYMEDNLKEEIKKANMEIKEIDSSIVLNEVILAHKNKRDTCLVITQDHPVVYVGKDDFNEDFCIKENIPIYRIGYSGGTIIASKDDLTLGIISNNPNLMPYFKSKLKEWITANFKTIKDVGNDLMIGDNKVIGTAIRTTKNKTLYCIQISFNVNLDLIKKISLKEMKKIPKGLNDFGDKTKEDLIKEIKIWLQK